MSELAIPTIYTQVVAYASKSEDRIEEDISYLLKTTLTPDLSRVPAPYEICEPDMADFPIGKSHD